jgi:hypothetical protein
LKEYFDVDPLIGSRMVYPTCHSFSSPSTTTIKINQDMNKTPILEASNQRAVPKPRSMISEVSSCIPT